jgi:hypothetical protein
MPKLETLIAEAKSHKVTFKNSEGKTWFELSLLWTLIIAAAQPQLLFLALVLYLIDVLEVEYDGSSLAHRDGGAGLKGS